MSLKDRFVDGVASLFDKVGDGNELGGVDAEALERELAARVAARKERGNPSPEDNPRAKVAGPGAKAREKRAALAHKRIETIHARRAQKEAARKRDQDAAFRRMAEEARRNPQAGARPGPSRPSSSSSGSRRPSIFQNDEIAGHYKTLGLEYGSDAAEVKSAYRKLMRKYHPDLHQDPKKKKAATELTLKITAAYDAIEIHLKK